jgi:hypothetical protein
MSAAEVAAPMAALILASWSGVKADLPPALPSSSPSPGVKALVWQGEEEEGGGGGREVEWERQEMRSGVARRREVPQEKQARREWRRGVHMMPRCEGSEGGR